MGQREPATPRGRSLHAFLLRLRRILGLGGLLCFAALTLSSCSLLPYSGASSKARLVHGLYIKTSIVALIVLVGVIATLIVELIAFRRRRGDNTEPVQDHGRPAVYI